MAFWSTQKVEAEARRLTNLIEPFDPNRIQQGAYELALSREVITTPPPKGARLDGVGKTLKIPPGQFALLYSQEEVTIPADVIAFISIKAKVKLDGLVNISGFHVDPGFSGRLKFSVYNAGNRPIFLEYERETFLIWFGDLDQATVRPYDKNHQHARQDRITPEDRQRMSDPSQSPAALDERLKKVEQKIVWIFAAFAAIATGILLPSVKEWIGSRSGAKDSLTQPAAPATMPPAKAPSP